MKNNLPLTISVSLLGALFVGGVLWATVKVVYRDRKIEDEINALKKQESVINNENKTLREQIAYQQTPAAQEMLAKQKLDRQKNDEQVAVVKPNMSTVADGNSPAQPENVQSKNEPNYKKWWKYFFGY